MEAVQFKSWFTKENIQWGLFAFFCLFIFTLIKVPKVEITGFVQDSIYAALDDQGIQLTALKTNLSVFPFPKYELNEVTLQLPSVRTPIRVDRLVVKPSILKLLTGGMGASINVEDSRVGNADLVINMSDNNFSIDYDLEGLNLSQLDVLSSLWGLKGGAILNGDGKFSGDPGNLSEINGNGEIGLKEFKIEPQSFFGFNIPETFIDQGKILISAAQGKAKVMIKLGERNLKSNALFLNLDGNIALAKRINMSQLDVNAEFKFSDQFLKGMGLIEAFLPKGAKKPDGSYSVRITGPAIQPNVTPVK